MADSCRGRPVLVGLRFPVRLWGICVDQHDYSLAPGLCSLRKIKVKITLEPLVVAKITQNVTNNDVILRLFLTKPLTSYMAYALTINMANPVTWVLIRMKSNKSASGIKGFRVLASLQI